MNPEGGNISASRAEVEQYFRVHDTPSARDATHVTVELPKPVTKDDAAVFNRLYGNERD